MTLPINNTTASSSPTLASARFFKGSSTSAPRPAGPTRPAKYLPPSLALLQAPTKPYSCLSPLFLSPQELITAYERWTADLDHWWLSQDLSAQMQSPDLSLVLFRLFAQIYVNIAASKESGLAEDPVRWRFRTKSVRAAYEMLIVVAEEPVASLIGLLLPFYVKVSFEFRRRGERESRCRD
jgi:hypothetical protein